MLPVWGGQGRPPLRAEMIPFAIQPRQAIIVIVSRAAGGVGPYGGMGPGAVYSGGAFGGTHRSRPTEGNDAVCHSSAPGDIRCRGWAEQSPAPTEGNDAVYHSSAEGDHRCRGWAEQSPAPTEGNGDVYHSNSPGACCPVLGGTRSASDTPRGTSGVSLAPAALRAQPPGGRAIKKRGPKAALFSA